MIPIIIKTPPISVNKLYGGRKYVTKEGKVAKEGMGWEVKSQWKKKPITGDVSILIYLYMKDKRSDIDNVLKGLLDCMTGIVWQDDKQIIELHVFKYIDRTCPRIELEIESLTE